MSKKLRLDLNALNVDTFATDAMPGSIGTVQGQMEYAVAGTIFSWCNTCDVGNATCGASCGSACQQTVNSPDCWTKACAGTPVPAEPVPAGTV